MRTFVAIVIAGLALAACATTSRQCPTASRLVTTDHGEGRVELCEATVAGPDQLPVQGHTYPSVLQLAHPSTMHAGVSGPFTHWYPDGTIESHGHYIEAASESVPDGVWAFWYADGQRKAVGRYDRGEPTGCFYLRDEQGGEVTGTVEGDQLHVENCEPPDGDVATAEARSQPYARRRRWGDVALHAFGQAGRFGASNPTQQAPDPSARLTLQASLRKHLGAFRVGVALGGRFSDAAASSYLAGVVGGYALPLSRRFGVELEGQLGVEYLDLTARRDGSTLVGHASFTTPRAGARAAIAFSLSRSVELVGGVGVDGWTHSDHDRDVRYCAVICYAPVMETWKLGGAAYGVDLAVRASIR